jgi:hypothetical protein
MVLWTISAVYLNQAYVGKVLTFIASAFFFIGNAITTADKFSKQVKAAARQAHAEMQSALLEADNAASSIMRTSLEEQAAARRRGQHAMEEVKKIVKPSTARGHECNVDALEEPDLPGGAAAITSAMQLPSQASLESCAGPAGSVTKIL